MGPYDATIMTVARSTLINAQMPGTYHCISRCVRRAFLCGAAANGESFEHRKLWIEQRLEFLPQRFAVEIMAYAVMSNHLHVVLRTRPDLAANWAPDAVARAWAALSRSGNSKLKNSWESWVVAGVTA